MKTSTKIYGWYSVLLMIAGLGTMAVLFAKYSSNSASWVANAGLLSGATVLVGLALLFFDWRAKAVRQIMRNEAELSGLLWNYYQALMVPDRVAANSIRWDKMVPLVHATLDAAVSGGVEWKLNHAVNMVVKLDPKVVNFKMPDGSEYPVGLARILNVQTIGTEYSVRVWSMHTGTNRQ